MDQKLEFVRQRTTELHSIIGTFSSYFAQLELQLIETLCICINPSEPNRAELALTKLSFRQCANSFRETGMKFYKNPEITDQVKEISKRLEDVSSKRNDIIHSSWIAYSAGDYGQHRARAKRKKSAGLEKHDDNPEQMIAALIEEIDRLLFDLICLEDELKNNSSEQGHSH